MFVVPGTSKGVFVVPYAVFTHFSPPVQDTNEVEVLVNISKGDYKFCGLCVCVWTHVLNTLRVEINWRQRKKSVCLFNLADFTSKQIVRLQVPCSA